jgi:transposase
MMDPTRMVETLVGLGPDLTVFSVVETDGMVVIEAAWEAGRPFCGTCGTAAVSAGWGEPVTLTDLCSFGRQARLRLSRRRWECCGRWTVPCPEVFPSGHRLTRRAAEWACRQVGEKGRTINDVADELGCDWHTVNGAVIAYGHALLEADTGRIGTVTAVGLDETSFVRRGRFRRTEWATTITDVAGRRLLDVVPGRTNDSVTAWFEARSDAWLANIVWACLDLSGSYRSIYNSVLPHAELVADAFHVVRLANGALDEVRRRVQNATLGHRGRKGDPLYRTRRRLLLAEERHTVESRQRMWSIVAAGDPDGEVRDAWLAKEAVRDLYTWGADFTADSVDLLGADLASDAWPIEVRRLGRTLGRWAGPIAAWHTSGLSNASTEGANNLIKRIKRIGFGFRSFRNYRIRVLLYAGKPNWDLLPGLTPSEIR